MIPSSPWTYLGHRRLAEIADRHDANIVIKPFDLGRVFPLSGGLPLPKRAPQRQKYRLAELARWRDFLDVAITLEPKFFPAPADPAMLLIAAAVEKYDQKTAFQLAGAIMKAIWAEEQNIADDHTLLSITEAQGLDYQSLTNGADNAVKQVEHNTQEAIDTDVFGSPWYRIDGQNFWGQDRLDFVERAVAG